MMLSSKNLIRLLLLLVLMVLGQGACVARNYTFSGSGSSLSAPDCVDWGTWSYDSSTATWTCSSSFSLASNDKILPASTISLVANGGITLAGNNTLGSASANVNLASSYGAITVSGTSTIYGDITNQSGAISVSNSTVTGDLSAQSGAITLSGSTVSGNLTTTSGDIRLTSSRLSGNITSGSGGNVTLTSSAVSGSISAGGWLTTSGGSVTGNVAASNGVTATNSTVFGGNVSASNAISLTGGSVAGGITSTCCTITATNVTIGSGSASAVIRSASNTVTLIGSTVAGTVSSSGGAGVVMLNSTMTAGSITTTNVGIWISGSSVGSSASPVNVTSNNTVILLNSTIYGNVTAGNWNTALFADLFTVVYGVCTSDNNSTTRPTQYPRCVSVVSSSVARFNACHNYSTSGSCSTAAGRLYTQRAGNAFSTDIVALKSDGTIDTSFTGKAVISIILKASTGATLDSQNCFPADAVQILDNATSSFTAGRLTLPATVASAYPDARFKVICDSSHCAGSGVTACSADDFAIRPSGFSSVTSSASADATGVSVSATPIVKAGAGFTLTATAGAGYNGTPKVNTALLSAHAGSKAVGALSATFGAATAATGVATASAVTYSEVGYFSLGIDGVYDDAFAFVDIAGGDCTKDYVNAPVNGKIGCYFGNTAATGYFGRFVPDHFAVTAAAPAAACLLGATPFTYFGEDGFLTSFTLTAQNSANGTTQNYSGSFGSASFARLDLSKWAGFGFSSSASLPTGSALAASATAPSGTWSSGVASVSAKHQLVRPTNPVSETLVTVMALPVDSDGVTMPAAAAVQSAATRLRFGKISVDNAYGSERLPLPVKMTAWYYAGNPAGWVVNTADACTSTLPLTQYSKNDPFSDCYGSCTSTVAGATGSVLLQRPSGNTSNGLAVVAAPTSATALSLVAGQRAVSLAAPLLPGALNFTFIAPAWLKSKNAAGTAYDANPVGLVTFGVYGPATNKTKFIYVRENY